LARCSSEPASVFNIQHIHNLNALNTYKNLNYTRIEIMKNIIKMYVMMFFLSAEAHSETLNLQQIAEQTNESLPMATSAEIFELYKVESKNDTLIFNYRFYELNNKEAKSYLYNTLRKTYCSPAAESHRNHDFKWEHVYLDSQYKYIYSFKVSKSDCN